MDVMANSSVNSETVSDRKIVWQNVIIMIAYHVFALNGIFYLITFQIHFFTILWTFALVYLSGFGVTIGAHRLWAHRCFKAQLPLRILLCFLQTMAMQNDVIEWSRDHRVHHKFTDTDADPHNANRGFFFSHMGWLLVRKHPDVITKGSTIDMSDLESDPVLRFQRKYYVILAPLVSFVFPMMVPVVLWNEDLYVAWCYAAIGRYLYTLHCTWLVNSAAHMWGMRTYDKNIKPAENPLVSFLTSGEGWHNYHHTFPWDYRAAELDRYTGNINKWIIDMMAKIGWAYDLKRVPENIIKSRIAKTGIGCN